MSMPTVKLSLIRHTNDAEHAQDGPGNSSSDASTFPNMGRQNPYSQFDDENEHKSKSTDLSRKWLDIDDHKQQ